MLLQAILATHLQNSVLDPGTTERSIFATAGTQAPTPSGLVVALNILMFSSLISSVGATMFGIFIKEWLHESESPKMVLSRAKDIARRNMFLFRSLDRWGIESILRWLFVLLQVSTSLFFAALLALLWEYHPIVAWVASLLVGCVFILATTSIVLPTIYADCCYLTPLTYPLYYVTQLITYFYRIIRSQIYRLIRDCRLALINLKSDEEGGDTGSRVEEVWRRYPTTIKAIVPWGMREQLIHASYPIDGELIQRYIGGANEDADPNDVSMILLLGGDAELESRSFLLSVTRLAMSSAVNGEAYRSSTIPVDFWIVSLLKIMPLVSDWESLHVNVAIFRALKHIEVARLWTPDRRLLQALSLVAHYSPRDARYRALAHQLLTKHLSSDEVVKDSPWSLARDGFVSILCP